MVIRSKHSKTTSANPSFDTSLQKRVGANAIDATTRSYVAPMGVNENSKRDFIAGYCKGYEVFSSERISLLDGERLSCSYIEKDLYEKIDSYDFGFVIASEWHVANLYAGASSDVPTIKAIKYNLRELMAFYVLFISSGRNANPVLRMLGVNISKAPPFTYVSPKAEDVVKLDELVDALCISLT